MFDIIWYTEGILFTNWNWLNIGINNFFHLFLQNETFLCRRFTEFVTKYNLMSKEILIVPILEGLESGIFLGQNVESEA